MSFNSRDFKGFTFRSGPVKKDTKQNSTFWDTNSNDIDVDTEEFINYIGDILIDLVEEQLATGKLDLKFEDTNE